MAGLALNCDVADRAIFARKNYFYPDLPKGYQISQFDEPICTGGHIDVPTPKAGSGSASRGSLEEDAAKNVHVGTSGRMHSVGSLVDFNRGGTPLMEIVTEPDIPSPEAARATANQLKDILRAVGVSEADMEKGQLRCDANVSIRNPDGTFGTKTELKNMNSFRFVERGLTRELERQREILRSGGRVEQTTLHYDPETDEVQAPQQGVRPRPAPSPARPPAARALARLRQRVRERLPELPEHMLARFVEVRPLRVRRWVYSRPIETWHRSTKRWRRRWTPNKLLTGSPVTFARSSTRPAPISPTPGLRRAHDRADRTRRSRQGLALRCKNGPR